MPTTKIDLNLTHPPVVRVLVIDDSSTSREFLISILQRAEGIQVIGSGKTGDEAVRLTRRMKPDVLLMDLTMPFMDGLEATRHIMHEQPTPIVLITGNDLRADQKKTVHETGALALLTKPEMTDREACEQLIKTVRSMARVPVVRRWSGAFAREGTFELQAPPIRFDPPPAGHTTRSSGAFEDNELKRCRLIGIASSTGGPGALVRLLKPLPAAFPLPILIVQHVTQGFAGGFAEWLDTELKMPVRLAAHGEEIRRGVVLIAPDDYHLKVTPREQIELLKAPSYHGLRPSANYLFHSMAVGYGPQALGIILTGMGDDGAEGMEALHKAGGLTIAQDEASCVVYGMPKEAVQRQAVDAVLSLEEITATLQRLNKK